MPEPHGEGKNQNPQAIADAQIDAGVMRLLPSSWLPYARLARLDRPIGTWLLFLPCLWGLSMASADLHSYPPASHIILFALGALIMRGAGCTLNDIADHDIDAKVARTANRPLPSGQVSLWQAWAFMIFQCLLGLLILLQFNLYTIWLGVASLVLVASYPFMKRVTWWPQFFLGLTFNWGALMGYSALTGGLSAAALALYGAGIFWTLGYDTIYAHQDREDDALVGVKSSALRLGKYSKLAISGFYLAMLALLSLAGFFGQLSYLFYNGMVVTAWHLAMQLYQLDIDRPDICLRLFRSNRDTGIIVSASILLGTF